MMLAYVDATKQALLTVANLMCVANKPINTGKHGTGPGSRQMLLKL